TFLIANDDGAESPFLPAMVAALRPLGTVRVCVPAEEQSWKAKAMSRWARIHAKPLPHLGADAFAVTGTPSDCVNLGLHHLFPTKPDWVISGINIGWNVGTSFAINSGTVGAAIEGGLCGVPSVAFSTHMPPELFQQWAKQRRFTSPEGAEIASAASARMARIMAALGKTGLPAGALMLNVNFPSTGAATAPIRWVPLEDNRYGNLFMPDGDGYLHTFVNPRNHLTPQGERPSDKDVVMEGAISATLVSLAGMSLPPPADLRLE
ncbi:MAG TPA: 5'/3'-nucleotidase SurE, partial [bacterium]